MQQNILRTSQASNVFAKMKAIQEEYVLAMHNFCVRAPEIFAKINCLTIEEANQLSSLEPDRLKEVLAIYDHWILHPDSRIFDGVLCPAITAQSIDTICKFGSLNEFEPNSDYAKPVQLAQSKILELLVNYCQNSPAISKGLFNLTKDQVKLLARHYDASRYTPFFNLPTPIFAIKKDVGFYECMFGNRLCRHELERLIYRSNMNRYK